MNRNLSYLGWRRVDKGNRHYYRRGASLCAVRILFEGAKNLRGGKRCKLCQQRFDRLPPERVPFRIVEV